MDNKYCFLALNRIPSVGPRTVANCLLRWPNLVDMFRLSSLQLEHAGLSPNQAKAIASFDWQAIEADLEWELIEQHTLLTWADPRYPALLREIHDPPIVLYAKGDLRCLEQPTVAMVGTRKPSATGSETAWRFASELARHDISIVSGLALGIDAQAHRGCLAVEGKTIAVMGTGIDCIYPQRHVQLAQQICKQGLLLSEFPLKSPPIAGHFPRRNRIISGLSSVILVIEAAIKSGSLITARLALEQNRDVLAVPGSIHNAQARGCHVLLQQGAKLITSSQDVLDELNLGCFQDELLKPFTGLASGNKDLVKCIGFDITTIDQIIVRSGLDVEKVICDLAELELQGVIKAVSGGYTVCR